MKTLTWCFVLGVVLAACGEQDRREVRSANATQCLAPGARCDFDNQCCSHKCDDYDCRGPMPGPGGP